MMADYNPCVSNWYTTIIVLLATLNNSNLGYDIGIVTSVAIILQEQTDFPISFIGVELFVGALDFAAIVGALFSNFLADYFGRKGCMIFSELIFILGVLGMAASQDYSTLLFFRFVTGLSVGIGFSIGPLYIGELVATDVRGKMVSWSEIATNVGITVAFGVGWGLSGLSADYSWRLMLGLGAVLPCFLLVALIFMPESPRWLVVNDREEEAKKVIQHVTYRESSDASADQEGVPVDVDAMVAEIKAGIRAEQKMMAENGWEAIFMPSRSVLGALLAGLGIAAIQQVSAIESITNYFFYIFDAAGGAAINYEYAYLLGFGLLKIATVYIASLFFDRTDIGRRPLLLLSGVLICVSMAAFAIVFSLYHSDAYSFMDDYACTYSVIAIMFFYVVAYEIGYGPGTWVIMSEVFPMHIRAKALSLANVINRGLSALLDSTFLSQVNGLTYQGFFFLFFFLNILGVIYIYFLIPETANVSLERMSEIFDGHTTSAALATRNNSITSGGERDSLHDDGPDHDATVSSSQSDSNNKSSSSSTNPSTGESLGETRRLLSPTA